MREKTVDELIKNWDSLDYWDNFGELTKPFISNEIEKLKILETRHGKENLQVVVARKALLSLFLHLVMPHSLKTEENEK